MKILLICSILIFMQLHADEIQRIESIVDDISKLRKEYAKVQSNYVEMEVVLEEEKAKNKRVTKELKVCSNALKKEEDYKKKIISLENQIKNLKKQVKSEVVKKKSCKKQEIKIIKNIIKVHKPLITQSSKDDNKFPNLLMKDGTKGLNFDRKPYAYRVKNTAIIYDGIDGKRIKVWEKMTSFTSNLSTDKWIKITGYFVNKVWKPSESEMWIKSNNALKRDNSE